MTPNFTTKVKISIFFVRFWFCSPFPPLIFFQNFWRLISARGVWWSFWCKNYWSNPYRGELVEIWLNIKNGWKWPFLGEKIFWSHLVFRSLWGQFLADFQNFCTVLLRIKWGTTFTSYLSKLKNFIEMIFASKWKIRFFLGASTKIWLHLPP